MDIDELRVAYEAHGLECQEYEQTHVGLEPGTVLTCEMLIDGHWLLIEAPYSVEGSLLRLNAQMPVPYPGGEAIDARASERAMAIVMSVVSPGHEPDPAEDELLEHLTHGECAQGCSVESGAGVWRLHPRPAFGGWRLRLELDNDPPA